MVCAVALVPVGGTRAVGTPALNPIASAIKLNTNCSPAAAYAPHVRVVGGLKGAGIALAWEDDRRIGYSTSNKKINWISL